MIRYASIIIKRAREEAELGREKLVEKIGKYRICSKTLQRIEEGEKAVKKESVTIFLDYFGIILPYELQDETEEHIMTEGLKKEDLSIKECLREINGAIAIHRTLFYANPYPLYDYRMNSIMLFLLYLPKIPTNCLYDALSRICGSCYRREDYVLAELDYLYRSIPETPSKQVLDRLAECVRGCGEGRIPADEDIKEYQKIIERKIDIEDRLYRIRSLIEKSGRIAEE